MYKLSILILVNLLLVNRSMDLFNQKSPIQFNAQFTEFDKNNHLRPKIHKSDFFRLTGFDFGWLLLEPINIANSREQEPELSKRFSPGQKALYFWWYLDAAVANGGFVQFYYNGCEVYIPAIIAGLELVGDKRMVMLVKAAHDVYLKNKDLMDKARQRDLFGSDLYDRLKEFEEFDSQYIKIHAQTMDCIEKYARLHPAEFCVDENGKEFKVNFTGKCITHYNKGTIKEEFKLVRGAIQGEFKTYYPTGQIYTLNTYESGVQMGEQKEWYENGNLKSNIIIDQDNKQKHKEYYFENGKISKLENTDSNDERKGEYKEWYQNGQLKEVATFISNNERNGRWLMFWEKGNKKLEAEIRKGIVYYNNYWNEQGEQLLKNGTGLYINEFQIPTTAGISKFRYDIEYKEYKRNGWSKSYCDGILTMEQEFKDGLENGIMRSYDSHGKLKEEKIFENGKCTSTKKNNE